MIARSHGLKAWLIQRLSAVYMVLYLVVAGVYLLASPPQGYDEWRAFAAHPVTGVATLLLFGMVLLHAWVGMRDVVMDYVHVYAARFMLLVLIAGILVATGVWVVNVFVRIW